MAAPLWSLPQNPFIFPHPIFGVLAKAAPFARGFLMGSLLLLLLAAAPPAQSQDTLFQASAVMAQAPPVIDGEVTDEEWAAAPLFTDFIQFEPRRGEPSAVRTEARILYDSAFIYVAFKGWDPDPVTAQLTRRDSDLVNDDSFVVLLDTFRDRQSAYLFAVNPLGTQADARVINDGRTSDATWDEAWRSEARIQEWGVVGGNGHSPDLGALRCRGRKELGVEPGAELSPEAGDGLLGRTPGGSVPRLSGRGTQGSGSGGATQPAHGNRLRADTAPGWGGALLRRGAGSPVRRHLGG